MLKQITAETEDGETGEGDRHAGNYFPPDSEQLTLESVKVLR